MITWFIFMIICKARKSSGIPYNFAMVTISKNKYLLIVTFIYCERNHNLSLHQFVTHLNRLKSTLNV